MGDATFLVDDLRVLCSGAKYALASVLNVVFVICVVAGWPLFISWYLRKISVLGRADNPRVRDRIGFLFVQYRPEYLYWYALFGLGDAAIAAFV